MHENTNRQGWDDPYVPRTHEGLLKWKYPEMNSVDFLYEVVSSSYNILCCDITLDVFCFCILVRSFQFTTDIAPNFWMPMLCEQIDDDDQLLFLFERGKKKLMEGNRVAFRG